jgi:hypothetical protein
VTIELLARVLFWVAVAALVYTFLRAHLLLKYLRQNHHEKWRSLGSPGLFRNTSRGYGSFIRSSEHRALGDENLNRLVRKYRNQIKVLLLIGSIFAILVLAELRWLD